MELDILSHLFGAHWGVVWATVSIFFIVFVKICEKTTDLQKSPAARSALEYITALASFVATFAVVVMAWYAAVGASGWTNETWVHVVPFLFLGTAFVLACALFLVAKSDNSATVGQALAAHGPCEICGHAPS